MTLNVDQLLLPFAEKEYIDVRRAARILGVTYMTIPNLYAAGRIEMIDYAKHKRKRVKYASVVALCDRLREHFGIPDRRAPLPVPYFRHRDEDLLPFPLSDTIYVEEVARILGYDSPSPVRQMIDEGRFEAYKISGFSPWRISRTSLAAYLQGVHEHARLTPPQVISQPATYC
jgi:excisionase family DNA binding protein